MFPQTYIPKILDHTYRHTYLDGGVRQGMPARYLDIPSNLRKQGMYVTPDIHTYL